MKYPCGRDGATGKVKYRIEKVGPSRRLALLAFQKKQVEFAERKHLDIQEERPKTTFAELADWYSELESTKALKTYPKVKAHCKTLKARFGSLLAEEIKPSMIEAYQQERLGGSDRGRKHKPASVNREVEVVRRIFNLAIREDKADRNPCWKVRRLAEKNARDRILSPEELNRLLEALPAYAADIVLVGYHTGMRAGEIYGLTWKKVNLAEGCIRLGHEDTKTKEGRRIYLNAALLELFQRLNRVRCLKDDHVFIHGGRPVTSIRVPLADACKAAGIEDFRFHDLRHTFVTNMRKAGVPESVIMKLTGHKTRVMFLRYNTVDADDAREAMGRFEAFLGAGAAECSHSAPAKEKAPDVAASSA